jgi:hypothetical protein
VRWAASSSLRPQQPQADGHVVAGHRHYAGPIEGGQADRDRVVLISLAAVSPGVHPDPGGQLGRDIQHQLAVRGQPLRQRPARAVASFHRPPPLRPPAGKRRQPLITRLAAGEPGCLDQGLGHRIEHGRRVAGLVRINGDHHVVAHGSSSLPGLAWRGGQCNYRQSRPLLSHVLAGGQGTGRRPFVSQNTPPREATAADSRASPSPPDSPRIPRSRGALQRSKQVAESARVRNRRPEVAQAYRMFSSAYRCMASDA